LEELARHVEVGLKLGVVDIFYEIVNFQEVLYVLWFLPLHNGIFLIFLKLVLEPKVLTLNHTSQLIRKFLVFERLPLLILLFGSQSFVLEIWQKKMLLHE
jgi:hypothetical protein